MTHMYFSPRTDGISTFRHSLRAAYRTAISAAQILVFIVAVYTTKTISDPSANYAKQNTVMRTRAGKR